MTTTNDQIRKLAAELSASLVRDKRNDGTEFIYLKDAPKHAWMRDVIRAVHGEKMPDDTTYKLIERCADYIAETDGDTEPADVICEIEPDIYTNDLTAWLHARVDHVEYLDQVLEEGGANSGTELLQAAQSKQICEVGWALVAELQKLVDEVSA